MLGRRREPRFGLQREAEVSSTSTAPSSSTASTRASTSLASWTGRTAPEHLHQLRTAVDAKIQAIRTGRRSACCLGFRRVPSEADLVQLSAAIAAEEDLGPFVRRAFACGRPEPLLASLRAAARDREDEIEELCHAHFHDFIHTIDDLRSLLFAMDALEQRETRELAPGTDPSQIKHKLADKFITNAHELGNPHRCPRAPIEAAATAGQGRKRLRRGELFCNDRAGEGAVLEVERRRRGKLLCSGGAGEGARAGGGGAPPPREAPSQLRQRLMLATFHCLEQQRRHDGGPGGASSGHGARVEGGERARNGLRWGGDPALGCASLERQNGSRG
nr:unnamed protein product [Digitaria exilis]